MNTEEVVRVAKEILPYLQSEEAAGRYPVPPHYVEELDNALSNQDNEDS